MWLTTVACVLFPAYFLFDVNYFIRSAFTVLYATTIRKKIGMRDSSTIYGISTFHFYRIKAKIFLYHDVEFVLCYLYPQGFVLTTDMDFLLTHMNNARVLRENDFARVDHATRSGFFKEVMKRGGTILLSSSFIRYRLPVPVFSRYKVNSR